MSDKLKMHSVNMVDENIKKIGELFPNCVTERVGEDGKIEHAIDFDVLKQELSSVVVEGNDERYQFTWPDKKKSVLLANAPIAKTLRPCKEESVDFDKTENLYIEGDNLDVLKLLQETYLGKIKMIYIDPPYNTGNDFVYEDDFSESAEEYLANSGQFDEQGNKLVANTESNGRFHTDWLNMIYPRLKLAKNLLSDDGVIFISIDDNEQNNLKKICDEIFGEQNFVGNVIWERAFAPKNDAKYFSASHDFILVYAKNLINFQIGKLPRTEEANARYKNPDNDPRGPWTPDNLTVKTYSAANDYPITTPGGRVVYPAHGSCWRVSRKRFDELVNDNRVYFGDEGNNVPRVKRFLNELKDGMTPTTIWKFQDVGHNQEGRQELKKIFDDKGYFDGPKPVRLIKRVLEIANTNKQSIVLDFFSGSATTAHAVIQLNAEDGGNRKFIMVQLPEETEEKSEAYKAGYKNICEIGKERIRRAGNKIKEDICIFKNDYERLNKPESENSQFVLKGFGSLRSNGVLQSKDYTYENEQTGERKHEKFETSDPKNKYRYHPELLDTGFRVLKLDSSNMKDIYYTPDDYIPNLFDDLTDNIKADRSPEDLLFQVMLDLGILLSSKIEETTVAGKKVFSVEDGFLMACFDENVTDETITAIAKQKPYYFVMRDSSMASDSVAANFEQIFATYSPDTVRKVL